MKILFINISDIKGGAAKSMWRIAEQLEKDYDTENLFLVRDKFSNQANVIATRSNKLIYKLEWAINVFFNLIGLQYKFLPFSSRKIMKEARRFRPDVISLNQIEGGYFQTRDMIKLGKIAPIVWTMHDLWVFNNNSHRVIKDGEDERKIYPQIGMCWGNWLLKQKGKIIVKKTDPYVVCPSKFVMSKMNFPFNLLRGRIIPHGIDVEKFKPAENKNNEFPTLLFVAEKLDKGGQLLWDILAELDKIIDFRVIIYLLGENKGNIKNTYKNISTYGTGYIWDEDELISYYQQADIFVYPSQADIFGLVLIEAMACELPIVTTNVDAIPEVLRNTNLSLQINSPPVTFAYVIKAILTNDYVRSTYRDVNRKIAVEFYNIKQTAKKYYELFKQIKER